MVRSIDTTASSLNAQPTQRLRAQSDGSADAALQRLSPKVNDGVTLTLTGEEVFQSDADTGVQAEKFSAGNPPIRDADHAQAIAHLTHDQIETQPDTALLAHANLLSQPALSKLLQY